MAPKTGFIWNLQGLPTSDTETVLAEKFARVIVIIKTPILKSVKIILAFCRHLT